MNATALLSAALSCPLSLSLSVCPCAFLRIRSSEMELPLSRAEMVSERGIILVSRDSAVDIEVGGV